jgi:hypothetical protein
MEIGRKNTENCRKTRSNAMSLPQPFNDKKIICSVRSMDILLQVIVSIQKSNESLFSGREYDALMPGSHLGYYHSFN